MQLTIKWKLMNIGKIVLKVAQNCTESKYCSLSLMIAKILLVAFSKILSMFCGCVMQNSVKGNRCILCCTLSAQMQEREQSDRFISCGIVWSKDEHYAHWSVPFNCFFLCLLLCLVLCYYTAYTCNIYFCRNGETSVDVGGTVPNASWDRSFPVSSCL